MQAQVTTFVYQHLIQGWIQFKGLYSNILEGTLLNENGGANCQEVLRTMHPNGQFIANGQVKVGNYH